MSRDTSTSSIFARAEKRLGRPLHVFEKVRVICKYTLAISLVPMAPVFIGDIWDARQLYSTPLEKTYRDVTLRLGGGGKSPTVIVITEQGRQIFVSPCDGLKESICYREEFSGRKTNHANAVEVIELAPEIGIIQRIDIANQQGQLVSVINHSADGFVRNYPRNPYQKNWFLLALFGAVSLVFFTLTLCSIISNSKRREA